MEKTASQSEQIFKQLQEHYQEALTIFPKDRIVGIFVQGSQNYCLDWGGSDLDTKCIVLPSFEEICFNKEPVSYTHVRENNEHIDFKDLRLMMQCFKKQNINFVEILFTKYYILNPDYEELFKKVMNAKEEVAHYNVCKFLKCTSGMSAEKLKALTLDRPSQHEEVVKYGWATKQMHHIIRLNEFMRRYLNGESFEKCLISEMREELIELKKNGHEKYSLEEAIYQSKIYDFHTKIMKNNYVDTHKEVKNDKIGELIDTVTCDILKVKLKKDILKEEE